MEEHNEGAGRLVRKPLPLFGEAERPDSSPTVQRGTDETGIEKVATARGWLDVGGISKGKHSRCIDFRRIESFEIGIYGMKRGN